MFKRRVTKRGCEVQIFVPGRYDDMWLVKYLAAICLALSRPAKVKTASALRKCFVGRLEYRDLIYAKNWVKYDTVLLLISCISCIYANLIYLGCLIVSSDINQSVELMKSPDLYSCHIFLAISYFFFFWCYSCLAWLTKKLFYYFTFFCSLTN